MVIVTVAPYFEYVLMSSFVENRFSQIIGLLKVGKVPGVYPVV